MFLVDRDTRDLHAGRLARVLGLLLAPVTVVVVVDVAVVVVWLLLGETVDTLSDCLSTDRSARSSTEPCELTLVFTGDNDDDDADNDDGMYSPITESYTHTYIQGWKHPRVETFTDGNTQG